MATSRNAVDKARGQGAAATVREFGRQVKLLRKQRWGNPAGYLLIAPAIILFLVFNLYPVLRGLQMAFMDMRYLSPETGDFFVSFNGLDNFREMFADTGFQHSFWVSVQFSFLYQPIAILFAVLVAAVIGSFKENKVALFTRMVMYIPVIVPLSVTMLMFKSLYDPRLGYINHGLRTLLPFIGMGPNWLGPQFALLALVIATAWTRFGYFALLLLIGVYQINNEIYEAASVDGAGALRKLWSITLPALRPIFVLILVLTGGILNATAEPLILTGGGPGDTTMTVGLYTWKTAFEWGSLRVGYAAAMGLFMGIVQMLFAFLVFRSLGLRTDE